MHRAIIFALILCWSPSACAHPNEITSLFKKITRYSVRVRRDNEKAPAVGSGTVILSKKGMLILTCAHVVGTELAVLVDIDEEGKDIRTLPAFVEKLDAGHDLAVLRVLGDLRLPAAPVAKNDPDLYEEMYTIGSPVTVMRQSSILRLNTKDALVSNSSFKLWTVSGTVIPGMSGSSVFNAAGEVVAVVKACLTMSLPDKAPTVLTAGGFVIPLQDIKDFLKE